MINGLLLLININSQTMKRSSMLEAHPSQLTQNSSLSGGGSNVSKTSVTSSNSASVSQFAFNLETLALPVSPSTPQDHRNAKKLSKTIDAQLKIDAKLKKAAVSVILLGTADSGKSTIFRQLSLFYGAPFTVEEREKAHRHIIRIIRQNFLRLVKGLNLLKQLHLIDVEGLQVHSVLP